MDIGFIIGADSIKAITALRGIPLLKKPNARGIVPQSHIGKNKPRSEAKKDETILFPLKTLYTHSSGI